MNEQDADGKTLFHYLFENNNLNDEMIKIPPENIDLNIVDKCGQTPLHRLCNNEKITKNMLELFFIKNAKIDIEDEFKQTPLQILQESNLNEESKNELVKLFDKMNSSSIENQETPSTPFNARPSFGNSQCIMLKQKTHLPNVYRIPIDECEFNLNP